MNGPGHRYYPPDYENMEGFQWENIKRMSGYILYREGTELGQSG